MKVLKVSPIYGNNIGDIMISKAIEYVFKRYEVRVDSIDILLRSPDSFRLKEKKDYFRIKISTFLQLKFPYVFA